MKDKTIEYYNTNAKEFFDGTIDANMQNFYDLFLEKLPHTGRILDLGCGSGRDSKYFLDRGYDVVSLDGSEELCKLASEYTGQPVICLDFADLDYDNEFDGIWACASLIHVNKQNILGILDKAWKSLKPRGTLYCSFKYGNEERVKDNRFFNDYTDDNLKQLFSNTNKWEVQDMIVTEDVRKDRTNEKWSNIIVNKLK